MIPTLYEPFRQWSENGSVYILSDLHFADSDCKLMDPNWITPEEQVAIINKMGRMEVLSTKALLWLMRTGTGSR